MEIEIEAKGKPEGCKLIRVTARMEGGFLRGLRIRGDFFATPEEGFERAEQRLVGCPLGEFATTFDALLREEGVECLGISGKVVAKMLEDELENQLLGELIVWKSLGF